MSEWETYKKDLHNDKKILEVLGIYKRAMVTMKDDIDLGADWDTEAFARGEFKIIRIQQVSVRGGALNEMDGNFITITMT